jgi:uncharacterized membrane protein YoaK (UPF0700 family)
MTDTKNIDPRVPLLLLLSVTTGLVDAASVLGLGRVFTANMTGNVVFLGFAASGAPGFKVAPYIAGIVFFVAGALMGGRAARMHVDKSERRWLLVAAVFETLLLWIAAVVAIGYDYATMTPEWRMFAIIGLTAVAMGFRNATIRQLKVADLTTTVLTMTLTGLGADSLAAGGANANRARRLAAVVAIFIGAAIGAALLFRFGVAAPLVLAGALVLFGTIGCAIYPPKSRATAG